MFDWQRSHRIQDLAVSPNGQYLVAMENETHIHVYNFMTRDLVYELDMKSKMGSVSISQNSRHLLVNKLDGEAQLLDLDTREIMVCYPNGEKGNEYAIRASFGGANESFVVIGSLGMLITLIWQLHANHLIDGHIYIYHKETGRQIEKLRGHGKGCCNAIAWGPDPSLFASAGDDGKVQMYASCLYSSYEPSLKLTMT